MPSEIEEIEPNDALKQLGITKFWKQGSILRIMIGERRLLLFDIDKTKVQKTFEYMKIAATEVGLNAEILADLKFILSKDYVKFLTLQQPKDSKSNKEKVATEGSEFEEEIKKVSYATVYADDTRLLEAVFIANQPHFAEVLLHHPDTPFLKELEEEQKEGKVNIRLHTEISLDEETVLEPLPAKQYVSIPYKFRSKEEFNKIVERVRGYRNLDPLFKKVEAIWTKYVDVGKEYNGAHQTLCAADTIFTYQQDRFGLTHYDFFIGDNTSGKSTNLLVLHYLAYRNMFSVGLSYANIYQFLGGDKEGAGTICEDEAQSIDEDADKLGIYNSGYTKDVPVFKTDTSAGRMQVRLNTFCFKGFAAEKLPDVVKAKGLLQRLVIFPCTYGFPEYDLSEVINPVGDEEFQWLLDELLEVRNELLIDRLLHYRDPVPNIRVNIKNREKQLFKPTLRLFQDSSSETLPKIQLAASKYITDNRKRRQDTLHAHLFKTVREMLKTEQGALETQGNLDADSRVNELYSTSICEHVKADLGGEKVPSKPMSIHTVDFDIVSQKDITKILKEVFGAKSERDTQGKVKIKFDLHNLDRLSLIYDQSTDANITQEKKESVSNNTSSSSSSATSDQQKDAKEGEV